MIHSVELYETCQTVVTFLGHLFLNYRITFSILSVRKKNKNDSRPVLSTTFQPRNQESLLIIQIKQWQSS